MKKVVRGNKNLPPDVVGVQAVAERRTVSAGVSGGRTPSRGTPRCANMRRRHSGPAATDATRGPAGACPSAGSTREPLAWARERCDVGEASQRRGRAAHPLEDRHPVGRPGQRQPDGHETGTVRAPLGGHLTTRRAGANIPFTRLGGPWLHGPLGLGAPPSCVICVRLSCLSMYLLYLDGWTP